MGQVQGRRNITPYAWWVSRLGLWPLWGLAGLVIALAAYALVIIWTSGALETRNADASGRRIMVALGNGEVEGKNISTKEAVAMPEAEKPPEPVTPEAAVVEETPSSPDAPEAAVETPAEAPADAPSETSGE